MGSGVPGKCMMAVRKEHPEGHTVACRHKGQRVSADAPKVQGRSLSLPLNPLPHYANLEGRTGAGGVRKEKEREDGGRSPFPSLAQSGLRKDRAEGFDGPQTTILIETRLE